MKRVSIWDLDYFYETINLEDDPLAVRKQKRARRHNPDVMKISSYHKQLGDQINFVTSEQDIYRPYDLYYIVKEKNKTPNPPTQFFLDPKVRWWGKAFRARINWRMSDLMLGCRADYLLYPEQDNVFNQSEHVRLFNNKAELLPHVQDWSNSFTDKLTIVTDPYMWFSDKKSIITALKMLQQAKRLTFLEPIWIQKIVSDKEIKDLFFQLNFAQTNSLISWIPMGIKNVNSVLSFLTEFRKTFPKVSFAPILFDYHKGGRDHWESRENALADYELIRAVVDYAKTTNIKVEIRMPVTRLETPYFLLFEELASWTKYKFDLSWLEYITEKYATKWGQKRMTANEMLEYWIDPQLWSPVFRQLLLQTYQYKDLLTHRVNNNYLSENVIPWQMWKEEFKYNY